MKKALALALALCMVLALMPVGVQAAAIGSVGQIPAQPTGISVGAVGDETAQPLSDETYTVNIEVVKNSSHGTVEQYATNAKAGESVYFLANPDAGYLVEFGGSYEYTYYEMELYYIGMDMYEIVMPDGDVDLEISFVKASGSNHNVTLNVSEGGSAVVTPTKAKEGESLILEVTTDFGYTLDYVEGTYGDGEYVSGYYLGESDGVHSFEIFMPGDDVELTVEFTRNGPYEVAYEILDGEGTVTLSHTSAYEGETVTATIVPEIGWKLTDVGCFFGTAITNAGGNKWTFQMPNQAETVYVAFTQIFNPVTLTVDTGIGGAAELSTDSAAYGETVTVVCQPEEGYRVAQITAEGVEITDMGGNVYEFTMGLDSVDVHVLFLRENNPFLDVYETHYFYDSVMWAVEQGITTGTTTTTFSPFKACERCQIVTFLWRYYGSPEPTITENPFTDVKETDYFYKAVLWAVENGITTGTTATTFSPYKSCERGQVVTFLWRAMGKPSYTVKNSFTDVNEGQYFYDAALWAMENGITTGTSAGVFSPFKDCERCQIVTFLYRVDLLPDYYGLHWVINGFEDTPSEYGTVTLSHNVAMAGETITATVVPADGYALDWAKCEFGTAVTQVSDTAFTFVMPEHEEVFHVNFVAVERESDGKIPPSDPEGTTYILNTATMKFHYPSCFTVDQISQENYHEYVGTRETLVEYGYDPCGHCDP